MSVSRLPLLFGLIAALASAASSANAQVPLSLEIQPVASSFRSGAPMTLEIELDWQSSGLLEGQLELTFFAGKKQVGHYSSGDLVLSTGGRRLRVMLPPMAVKEDLLLLAVNAQFVAEDATYDLGKFEFRVPAHRIRQFVIAVAHPADQLIPAEGFDVVNALRLDQFNPDESLRAALISVPVRIVPEDLPANGLGYYSYDLLLLAGRGFSLLSETQLDAIASWVEAGGSVCIIANGAMTPAHAKFLNSFVKPGDAGPLIVLDETGQLNPATTKSGSKFKLCRKGLGRAVIMSEPPDLAQDSRSQSWREMVAFLWKVRRAQKASIQRTGQWQFQSPRNVNPWDAFRPFQPMPIPQWSRLPGILLPDKVQGIPFGVVVVILALFLFAIAPGDYLLLGYLNRRRYTWILLPALSLGFTLFTAQLAKQYMGSTDYRTALVFVDVTERNRIARTSRFELLFTATQRTAETRLRNSLFVGMAPQAPSERAEDPMLSTNFRSNQNRTGTPRHDDNLAIRVEQVLPVYEGRMPYSFSVRQRMRKWSPQLSRQSALGTDAMKPPFNFDSIDPNGFLSTEKLTALRESILQVVPGSTVLLFNKSDRVTFGSVSGAPQTSHIRPHDELTEFIKAVCVRPPQGLFQIVSHISPTGGSNFEDLTLLDTTDANQWLLVIVTTQGDEIVVYRKLYTLDGGGR